MVRAAQPLTREIAAHSLDGWQPLLVGDLLEVEAEEQPVEGGLQQSGDVARRVARVSQLLGGRRFLACVDGDATFVEEFGEEDEMVAWWRADTERAGRLRAAWELRVPCVITNLPTWAARRLGEWRKAEC